MKMELNAVKENLSVVFDKSQSFFKQNNIGSITTMSVLVAIEEIYINIASYAYDNDLGKVVILVDYNEDTKNIFVEFFDSGKPFNPLTDYGEDDAAKRLNDLIPGGLGIKLVKKTMENLKYRRENGQNIFSFEKNAEENKCE